MSTLLRCWIRELLVGWHQGRRERAERNAQRHAAAEAYWRSRRDECPHAAAGWERADTHARDGACITPDDASH